MQDAGDSSFGGNIPEFSVEEISHAVRSTVESRFGRVRVRGEISSVSTPSSGHVYLTFKQDRHELAGVIWRSRAQSLGGAPEAGVEYLATGKLTAYSGKSSYQMIIDRLEPAGEGALLALLRKRREELEREGLFDADRKRAIPYLPEVIGVVSSPGGAVIRDIMHVVRDRFPRHVLLWPVAVQGEACAEEVAAAIAGFNALNAQSPIPRPDLLIVARGGGSVEDLLGFSDEKVVRAAAASEIPIISAVGHETDTPLIDLAADLRAPTPSAAAEKAVPVRDMILTEIGDFGNRLDRAVLRMCERNRQRVGDIARGLPRSDALFAVQAQRLDHLSSLLVSGLSQAGNRRRVDLARWEGRLQQPAILAQSRQRLSNAEGQLSARRIGDMHAANQSRAGEAEQRLRNAVAAALASARARCGAQDRLLETLGYGQVLKRGFAVVRRPAGIVASREVAAGEAILEIEFRDGRIDVAPKAAR